MTLTIKQLGLAADLAGFAEKLEQAISRLDKMDADPMAEIIGQIGFGLLEFAPSLSPDAARQIRTIMRADYKNTRADVMRRLHEIIPDLQMDADAKR